MQRNPLTNNGNAKVTTVFNLKLEALSDATLISGVDFDAFVHDLSGLDKEQKINYITEKKAPYLFSSAQLEQVLELTPSVETCMVIMAELGPRLTDPKANSFVAKFRYVEEKQKVEEILKARAQVISLASFNSNKSSSSSSHLGQSTSSTVDYNPVNSESTVIDIGINITNKQLLRQWRKICLRAQQNTVSSILLTGTSIRCVEESIRIAHEWNTSTSSCIPGCSKLSLHCTVGVHPHDAKHFNHVSTISRMRELAADHSVVAIGECGLDFNRNFSTKDEQIRALQAQLLLACELKMPLFVHEREAHETLLEVIDRHVGELPPVVVHCFTGNQAEALAYVNRGFYIGFTGTICKHERGAPLRDILKSSMIPLSRIMAETDAPFMGFNKNRRHSEPADVNAVVAKIAECMGISTEDCRRATTANAIHFFKLAQ